MASHHAHVRAAVASTVDRAAVDSDPAPTGAGRVRHGLERTPQAGAGVGHEERTDASTTTRLHGCLRPPYTRALGAT
jgi:hypothetical protein